MKSVYLAGAISGLTHEEATARREEATRLLSPLRAVSPMRGKDELRGKGALSGDSRFYAGNPNPFSQPSGIVTRDRFDVMTCDAVLMDLASSRETGRVSIGTMVELGWADSYRKPVVVVWGERRDGNIPCENPHEHVFVRELAGFHVETLEQAADILKTILL